MHFVPSPFIAFTLEIFLFASGSSLKWDRIEALLACLADRSPLEVQQVKLLHQDLVGRATRPSFSMSRPFVCCVLASLVQLVCRIQHVHNDLRDNGV